MIRLCLHKLPCGVSGLPRKNQWIPNAGTLFYLNRYSHFVRSANTPLLNSRSQPSPREWLPKITPFATQPSESLSHRIDPKEKKGRFRLLPHGQRTAGSIGFASLSLNLAMSYEASFSAMSYE